MMLRTFDRFFIRFIYRFTIFESSKIDLSYLQRGLYFLHIFSDTGAVFFQKIIKE